MFRWVLSFDIADQQPCICCGMPASHAWLLHAVVDEITPKNNYLHLTLCNTSCKHRHCAHWCVCGSVPIACVVHVVQLSHPLPSEESTPAQTQLARGSLALQGGTPGQRGSKGCPGPAVDCGAAAKAVEQ